MPYSKTLRYALELHWNPRDWGSAPFDTGLPPPNKEPKIRSRRGGGGGEMNFVSRQIGLFCEKGSIVLLKSLLFELFLWIFQRCKATKFYITYPFNLSTKEIQKC